MIRNAVLLSACLLFSLNPLHAASAAAQTAAPAAANSLSEPAARPIQDNSFLIEEAYNQEYGVVQHINTLSHSWTSQDWVYTFTQEWPMGEHYRNQLSYTLSGMRAGAFPGSGPGLGDLALNYRYQLVGSGETRVAFAPRFTVLLPTGDTALGRGYGGAGIQLNLPLSVVLGRKWVTHWNAGTTLIPSARNAIGERAAANGYNLGQSTIWLAKPRFNVMVETVWSGAETVVGPNATQRSHSFLISPGIRWAHNLPRGLQIVPGIGVPLGVGPSRGDRGVFLYLSLEHPFVRTER